VEQVSMTTNNQNNHKQQQQSRPNLETKVHNKTTVQPKNKQDKESKEKITTPRSCSPSSVQLDLLWGRD